MGVEFEVLGEIRARVDGAVADLGTARQRAVLAALVLEPGRPVTLDQVVDRVWGDHAPGTVVTSVRSYVSKLRTILRGVDIVGRAGAYTVDYDPDALDAHRFTALLKQARQTPDDAGAAEAYRAALELWRGEPFSGMETPWFAGHRHALAVARHTAWLDHTDIRLRRGEHAEVLPDLVGLALRYPQDERVAAALMLALYLSGRQAEALEQFDRTRKFLASELGTDPGPELAKLHERILRAEVPVAVSSVPRQLPARPQVFAGRLRELDALGGVLDGRSTVVISAIGGAGGVGKTWLALHWAHERLEAFPDGQLYANLRGFDPSTAPVRPEVVLRSFLDALGVEPEAIPADADAQASVFRSVLARRRMLIVLDNARDAAQIVPLLPGSGPSRVVVTSRNRLAALVSAHGAYPLTLDVLDDAEARAVLVGHLGEDRVAAEPDAVDAVLRYCAGLPLALGIVAARALVQSELPLSALADELRDETARLDAVDTGDSDVNLRAVLSWSVRALSADAQRLFALLGLVPGADVAVPAVESLSGAPVQHLLDELEHAHLVSQHVPGRYRMHDLVKLYAAEHRVPDAGRALDRLVDHYLHTAYTGERDLFPERANIPMPEASQGTVVEAISGTAPVMAWFEAEGANLLAIRDLAGSRAWQLAWSATTYHVRTSKYADRLQLWLAALPYAEDVDLRTLTLAHRSVADAYAHLDRHDEAMQHLQRALVAAEASGDPVVHGNVHYGISAAYESGADYESAVKHSAEALRIYSRSTNQLAIGQAYAAVGWHSALLGRYDDAREHTERAREMFTELNAMQSLGCAVDTLALVANKTGDHTGAVELCREALRIFRDARDAARVADATQRLGEALIAVGDTEAGRAALVQAHELLVSQGRTSEAERVAQML
ncbi:BTAD domain-containing putative transcriptional regulator [Lentzea sp. NPDC034063]|uniref:AfsR/SARP family transcriptional regulator n=1 Tax=unclassified Lentzea TaxID=2643253 RepID=UPI0033DA9068